MIWFSEPILEAHGKLDSSKRHFLTQRNSRAEGLLAHITKIENMDKVCVEAVDKKLEADIIVKELSQETLELDDTRYELVDSKNQVDKSRGNDGWT